MAIPAQPSAAGDSFVWHGCDNAWYVINPRHEYNIINFQNAVAKHQEYEEPYFDRIDVEKKGGKESGTYYFNIRNLLEEYYRKFPE